MHEFTDELSMNANAQHVLAAMLCDAMNIGFDGGGEGGRNMREGFAHLMRLLQRERDMLLKPAADTRMAVGEA